MVFVDSNIPMYLIGADHPHKLDAQRALERLIAQRRRLLTSSEVFQEILHRYTFASHRERIEPAFEALVGVVDEVLAVDKTDVFLAKDLLHAHPSLSARDSLHVAVMRRYGIGEILSFDRGFDPIAGIVRQPST